MNEKEIGARKIIKHVLGSCRIYIVVGNYIEMPFNRSHYTGQEESKDRSMRGILHSNVIDVKGCSGDIPACCYCCHIEDKSECNWIEEVMGTIEIR